MAVTWSDKFATRIENLGSSVIREILKLTQQPNIVSFAGGLPAPEFFPIDEIEAAYHKILHEHGKQALQYSVTEGYQPLRELVAQQMSERWGVSCSPDNVRIVSGSQQGLDNAGKVLINPGDEAIVGEPTYLGIMQAWIAYQPVWVTVPADEHSLDIHAVKDKLKSGVGKLLYTVPTFQNPSGATMLLDRREQLVEAAEKHDLIVMEDNPYGDLRYDGEHLPPLLAIDALAHRGGEIEGGNIIYTGSFSKILAPGLRVGFVIGSQAVLHRMTQAKQGDDVHTSTINQMIAYELGANGFQAEHTKKLIEVYRERRDLMLNLMDELFPPGLKWTRPNGGMFTWVELPESMNAVDLLKKAVEQNVAFVPGHAFYANGGGENTFRLNFSNAKPEQIEEGMKLLAGVIRAEMASIS